MSSNDTKSTQGRSHQLVHTSGDDDQPAALDQPSSASAPSAPSSVLSSSAPTNPSNALNTGETTMEPPSNLTDSSVADRRRRNSSSRTCQHASEHDSQTPLSNDQSRMPTSGCLPSKWSASLFPTKPNLLQAADNDLSGNDESWNGDDYDLDGHFGDYGDDNDDDGWDLSAPSAQQTKSNLNAPPSSVPNLFCMKHGENHCTQSKRGNRSNCGATKSINGQNRSLFSSCAANSGKIWHRYRTSPSSTSASATAASASSIATLSADSVSSNTSRTGCVAAAPSKTVSWANLLENELVYTDDELHMPDGDQPTEASALDPPHLNAPRNYYIVTTAALPWMTGTAVNPLLRAAYLSRSTRSHFSDDDGRNNEPTVTLVLPWLESPQDRVQLYGEEWRDATPAHQEAYIRRWLSDSAQMPLEADPSRGGIEIEWYEAKYHSALSSIFAMGDLCQRVPAEDANKKRNTICILEEPEHVNFYRSPGRLSWRDKFHHVIGIVHTNYKAYARNHCSGLVMGPFIGAVSTDMVRAYCDKVIKLSPVLQRYAPEKEIVCNVHGIRNEFFQKERPTGNKIYFVGNLLWAKGLDKMLGLQMFYKRKTGAYFPIDVFGGGPDEEEIRKAFLNPHLKCDGGGYSGSPKDSQHAARAMDTGKNDGSPTVMATSSLRLWFSAASSPLRQHPPIPATFCGRKDHAAVGSDYKIFVNPSITEVLCTTTAESIAMGKWVIIPKHASNEFFLQFPNCLQYSTKQEFVEALHHALQHPTPLQQDELLRPLTWEAATQRFLEVGCIAKRDARRRGRIGFRLDETMHYTLGHGRRGDVIRKVLGGGPVANQHKYETSDVPSDVIVVPSQC